MARNMQYAADILVYVKSFNALVSMIERLLEEINQIAYGAITCVTYAGTFCHMIVECVALVFYRSIIFQVYETKSVFNFATAQVIVRFYVIC